MIHLFRKPEGGVNAGEEFVGVVYSEQPLPPAPPVKISQTSQVLTNVDIPIGHFRDDMFDCCFDLPLACFAFWCQPSKYSCHCLSAYIAGSLKPQVFKYNCHRLY